MIQTPDVHFGNASADEGEGQRTRGNRRHQRLRRGRNPDRFLETSVVRPSTSPTGLFQNSQIGPDQQQIELVRSRFTGGVKTVIARKVAGPDGELIGVISRAVAPATFENFFSSVMLGENAAISMLHRDGTMLARHPHIDAIWPQLQIGSAAREAAGRRRRQTNAWKVRRQSGPAGGGGRIEPLSIVWSRPIPYPRRHRLAAQTRLFIATAVLSARRSRSFFS